MPKYTIIANITGVDKTDVYIKGVGKYLFEDVNKKYWNLLEEFPMSVTVPGQIVKTSTKLIDEKTPLKNGCLKEISAVLFANAMLQKKSLQLMIEESGKTPNSTYKIIGVEVP